MLNDAFQSQERKELQLCALSGQSDAFKIDC